MPSKPVLVLVAVAAGVSLAGCNSHSGSGHGHSKKKRKSHSMSYGSTAGKHSATSTRTAQPASTTTGKCRSTQLAASAHAQGSGTAVVVLRNTGTGSCTMYGFPGVDLTGKDGPVSAERSTLAPTTVRLAAGGSASFTLHYPPNTSGGSGVTFTGLSVTPPDGTSQLTVPLSINLPVGDTSQPVTVDPVRRA